MEEFEKAIFQKNEEVQSLNAMIEGLKEEASESEKNLKDVLKTYEGLLNHVSSLESALNGKDEQIRTLLTQHIDLLVHKNKENEETIASLRKDLEHQCMYIIFMHVAYIYSINTYVHSLHCVCIHIHVHAYACIHQRMHAYVHMHPYVHQHSRW